MEKRQKRRKMVAIGGSGLGALSAVVTPPIVYMQQAKNERVIYTQQTRDVETELKLLRLAIDTKNGQQDLRISAIERKQQIYHP